MRPERTLAKRVIRLFKEGPDPRYKWGLGRFAECAESSTAARAAARNAKPLVGNGGAPGFHLTRPGAWAAAPPDTARWCVCAPGSTTAIMSHLLQSRYVGACRVYAVVFQQIRSYFTLRHRRSTKTLSRQAPRPSMDSLQPWSSTTRVNSCGERGCLVGVDDLRECRIGRRPVRSPRAWQASSVIATLCASTLRLATSTTAVR